MLPFHGRKVAYSSLEVALLRILLVEDDGLVSRALSRTLSRFSHVVVAAGVDAAAGCLESDTCFDLILCDVFLGPRSGIDLYRILVERDPELASRLAFMTGLGDRPDELAEFRHVPCLAKPIDPRAAQLLAESGRGMTSPLPS